MIFSRFDHGLNLYRYYVADDVPPSSRGIRPVHAQLGTPVEEATPALPLGAKEIGVGEEAIGRIAKPGLNTSQIFRIGLYALAIYGAWSLLFSGGGGSSVRFNPTYKLGKAVVSLKKKVFAPTKKPFDPRKRIIQGLTQR